MGYESVETIGATVFQIIADGVPGNIVPAFGIAMEQIGFTLAGPEHISSWRHVGEFPGIDTVELAGSFFHRIRYEMAVTDREFTLQEHKLSNFLGGSSIVRTIPVSDEFDPAFVVQHVLNDVALGLESVDTAARRVETVVGTRIKLARLEKSDADILAELRDTSQRMGGFDFIGDLNPNATDFLDRLPVKARERLEALLLDFKPKVGPQL